MYSDPATELKVRQAEEVTTAQPVAYAQTAGYGNTYAQPTYAQPAGQMGGGYAQPTQQFVQPTIIQGNIPIDNHPRRPAPYRWADSICDWPKNLFPSCYCVCCCCYGVYIVAQMAEKTGMGSFRSVVTTYIIVGIAAFILELIFPNSRVILWLPMICAFFYALALRLHIVRKDHITECGESGALGECCTGFWCWYCSVAQMARHVYGYTKVLDGDGDPQRPDGYGPVQQV